MMSCFLSFFIRTMTGSNTFKCLLSPSLIQAHCQVMETQVIKDSLFKPQMTAKKTRPQTGSPKGFHASHSLLGLISYRPARGSTVTRRFPCLCVMGQGQDICLGSKRRQMISVPLDTVCALKVLSISQKDRQRNWQYRTLLSVMVKTSTGVTKAQRRDA